MPIVGLTDQGARFPCVGHLRKGAPKVSDRQPGKDLDHFRFDADDAEALAAFQQAYGETPRAINVYLPYASVDENLSAWQEHWVKGGLVRRCDGRTCVLRRLPNGKYDTTPQPCACTSMPADSKDRCKPVGRLQVIIPELKRLAYVVALTSSIHDIRNLSQQLTALELANSSLRGIPLVLRRKAEMISMPDDKGGRVRREKWLLSIEAAPRWVGLQLEAMERHALEGFTAAPQLPAPSAPMLAAPAYDDRPAVPYADASTGEVLDLEDDDPAEAPAARDTAEYVELGKMLRAAGLTTAKLKAAGVAWRLEDIAAMPDEHYDALIARMIEMGKAASEPAQSEPAEDGASFAPAEAVNDLVPEAEPTF
jgi:hypothetical protein